jgi:hypothetical protein
VYEINKQIFFLSAYFIFRGMLDLDKYIFPWQVCCSGGHLILESICIWVNTVYIHTHTHTHTHIQVMHTVPFQLVICTLVAIVATVVVDVEANCDPCEVHCDRILMFY